MSTVPPLGAAYFQGTQFGLTWLGLCTASYIQDGNKNQKQIIDTIRFAFNPTDGKTYIPAPPDPTTGGSSTLQGSWSVDWGPALTEDGSNLVYVASFRSQAGKPFFFATVIRGTDIYAGDVPVIQQVFQDFDAVTMVDVGVMFDALPPIEHPPGKVLAPLRQGLIATGTSAGFKRQAALIASYKAGGKTSTANVGKAVLDLISDFPGTPLVVTGHSLGGCQTQIMAAYLAWWLSSSSSTKDVPIYPNPIAPSTAGGADFAANYDKLFPYGNFWFNQLDVVPCGFANLSEIAGLWTAYPWPAGSSNTITGADMSGQPGPQAPSDLTKLVNSLIGKEVGKLGYTRPSVGQQSMTQPLPTPQAQLAFLQAAQQAKVVSSGFDPEPGPVVNTLQQQAMEGLAMLEWQHFPPCYHQLMSKVAGVLPYPLIDSNAVPVQA